MEKSYPSRVAVSTAAPALPVVGTDRFGVWPEQNEGNGSYFCGRGALGGNGCSIGGDAIQYLRDVRKYSYQEACDCLGITPRRGGESLQYKSPVAPKRFQEPAFVPKELDYPEDVVDPALWREHGIKFVDECHAALLARPAFYRLPDGPGY